MRYAINRTQSTGRSIVTAAQDRLPELLDIAQHGDTLHKLTELPATGNELVSMVDAQLASGEFKRV